jgi:hypothetical protein
MVGVGAMRGLYVNDSGRGELAGGDLSPCGSGGDDPLLLLGYEWAVVTSESGTLGGVGGSGDMGDDPSPVSDEGGVMEAIDANMAAVLVGVAGIGVELPPLLPPLPPLPPSRPPIRPASDGLGLAIPLLGGLIRFSF